MTYEKYIDYYKDEQIFYHHNKDVSSSEHHYGMHAHEIYEILYLISGEGEIVIEGTHYPLQPNALYIIRSNEAHYTKIIGNTPYERIVLHFYPHLLQTIDPKQILIAPFEKRQLGIDNYYPLQEDSHNIIRNAFLNIENIPSTDTYSKRITITANLFALLAELQKMYIHKSNQLSVTHKKTIISEIITYINQHLFEDISVETLCEHFFISRSHLNTLFKEATSATIWNYVSTKRLITANNLLQNGMSAQETACYCGYNDYSAFYRAYKKQYGVSPSEKK